MWKPSSTFTHRYRTVAAVAAAAAAEGGRLLLLLLLVMMPLLLVLRGVRWGKAQYRDEKEKK